MNQNVSLLQNILLNLPISRIRCLDYTTSHLYNICTLLDQRRRRWPDVLQNVIQMVLCLLGQRCTYMCPAHTGRCPDVGLLLADGGPALN